MKRLALVIVLAVLLVAPALSARGQAIVYQYELVSSSEDVIPNDTPITLPAGAELGAVARTYDDLWVSTFVGTKTHFVLSGDVCTSLLCYIGVWHYSRVELEAPEPSGPMGWAHAPLVKDYDASAPAAAFWGGRWVAVTVTNSVGSGIGRNILVFIIVIYTTMRATRAIRAYLTGVEYANSEKSARLAAGVDRTLDSGTGLSGDGKPEGRE